MPHSKKNFFCKNLDSGKIDDIIGGVVNSYYETFFILYDPLMLN